MQDEENVELVIVPHSCSAISETLENRHHEHSIKCELPIWQFTESTCSLRLLCMHTEVRPCERALSSRYHDVPNRQPVRAGWRNPTPTALFVHAHDRRSLNFSWSPAQLPHTCPSTRLGTPTGRLRSECVPNKYSSLHHIYILTWQPTSDGSPPFNRRS